MSQAAKNISSLSEEQRKLISLLLKEQGIEQKTSIKIPQRSVDQEIMSSFPQESMWFLQQLNLQSPYYNVPAFVRLQGLLDVHALESSLRELIQRHEVLRTCFVLKNSVPMPEISSEASFDVPCIDLRSSDEDTRSVYVQQLAQEEARHPFDLTQAPLLRARLFLLEENDAMLLITMHHIIADGWSMGILVKEVAQFYAAHSYGLTPQMQALPIQYSDYAIWQRTYLEKHIYPQQLDYWRTQLADAPRILDLPADHVRPAIQTFQGARYNFTLAKPLLHNLKEFSEQENVTLFMTLFTAFSLLLYQYTQQQDILIGTPVAGRAYTEIEELIGCFVNTLVLRARFSGNLSFKEVLYYVRSMCTAAYTHQDLPFEQLVKELHPVRYPSRTPFFQVLFALQNTPSPVLQLGEVALHLLPIDIGTAKTDLSMELTEDGENLRGAIEYTTDLFKEKTIARFALHFETLLNNILLNPDIHVADISCLTAQEKQQILYDWNEVPALQNQADHVVHLFEQQVARTPEAIAIITQSQHLTFYELNKRANQLAHYLRNMGIGREVCVGLCAEHSPELIVGILGILKAGAAYVPLDPTYPAKRLAFMLNDTRMPVLLTQHHLLKIFPKRYKSSLICLDSKWQDIEGSAVDNLNQCIAANQLIYVIYTSGSNGRPKGTGVHHSGFSNLLTWYRHDFRFATDDHTLIFSSIGFDLTQKDIFAALTTGGTLHLLSSQYYDPQLLIQTIVSQNITRINCTPNAFYPIVEKLATYENTWESLCSLRYLFLGGESIDLHRLQNWLSSPLCRTKIVNTYGPTECSDVVGFYRLEKREDDSEQVVPLGKPIPQMQLFVLNKALHLVPIGVPGELYIGGIGVGRGYLHNPSLTATCFVPHPFSKQPGARLYKTGDMVRYRSDGNLEFLGRFDNQVKIRGFRIELQEIEVELLQHPGVREAVAVVHEDHNDDKRIIAYVVLQKNDTEALLISPEELRQVLRTSLPEYMIPSAFVQLDAFPLTLNGKIDRHALPSPQQSNFTSEAFVAPRNYTEDVLVDIWKEVLGITRVSIHDNFFDLGGHSLLVIQVVARFREREKKEIPIQLFFERPTIAGLADVLSTSDTESTSLPLNALPRSAAAEDSLFAGCFVFPASFAQQRIAFLSELDQQSNAAYHLCGGIKLTGTLNVSVFKQTLQTLVARHETFRTSFVAVDGQWQQVIAPYSDIEIHIIHITENTSDQLEHNVIQRYLQEEMSRPFDLSQGPLLRVTLLQLNAQEHILLLLMHHIISDGWSLGILLQELSTVYRALLTHSTPTLPALPIQYADFAVWQRSWLQGEVLQQQLEYWRHQLAGTPATLSLPTDHPRPRIQSFRGTTLTTLLPVSLLQTLQEFSQQEEVSLFMTLLTAFQVLLSRYSGQQEIVVGSPIANRQRRETEALIGFFVNTLVLRADFSDNPPFRQALQRVREVCLQAYSHQDVPFEQVVEALHPQRSLSYSPLFQVLFTLQNMPLPPLELPELTLHRVDLPSQYAHFDLSLSVQPVEEGLEITLEYATDLFDASSMQRLLTHYQRLLTQVVQDPQTPLLRLSLLDEAERTCLLEQWGQGEPRPIVPQCIHELFEQQVARTPHAIALLWGTQQLTYEQLNQQANQLACYLQHLGVGPDVLVGVYMERSLEMIIALLGILKASGAYVPLDPTYPSERIAFMLEDLASDATNQQLVLLTQSQLVSHLPAHNAHVLCLDADWMLIAQEENINLACLARANNLAYVIYTSGSTGKPKGALNTQRGICNRLLWMQDEYRLTAADAVLQKTPFSFDVSVWEFFWPLLAGARLVIARPEGQKDSTYLLSIIQEQQITTLHFVPSMLQVFLEEPEVAACSSLRQVICSGESLSYKLQERFFACHPTAALHNLYGPTEAAIDVTFWACQCNSEHHVVPIGHPIANIQLYILDYYRQPVPIGVQGELYIGGVGVARGYLNRPQLTAERFVADPFSTLPSAHLYRTGDIARYLPDGAIEFLGRLDEQVKLRGFRIELGEIEAALRLSPLVKEAVVVMREDRPDDRRLVAYIVLDPTQPASSSLIHTLRQHLLQQVPEYMVPASLLVLEQMPLTPNGKLDRHALPVPSQERVEQEHAYLAPHTPLEQELVAIWEEILGITSISVTDNFFELGGHSLLATQVVARIRENTHKIFSLRTFFEYPTIQTCATTLEQVPSSVVSQGPALVAVSRDTYRRLSKNIKE